VLISKKGTIWVNEGSYFLLSDFMVMENSNEISGEFMAHHSKNNWTTGQDFRDFVRSSNWHKLYQVLFQVTSD
jgi:hypothetical protein